ncbi:SLAM family member 5-like [Pseudophryne corroboree]|uniref:SLAM family member 5-like n=1 Tax=Pseudophryne corroboree TaxID=495146 RepID=UPI003081984C
MLDRTPELIFMTLSACLLASARDDDAVQVSGLINQSVQLSNYRDLRLPIEEIMWRFSTNGRTVKVAEIKNNIWTTYYPQFSNRLQRLNNGETLVITHLSTMDSGDYAAEITLTNKQLYIAAFILNVYEPVPHPAIRIGWEMRSSDWCNMSLHCSDPTNTSALSYTWKYRHRDSDYHLYNNGGFIQVSLQPESWDLELLCVVHNPVDQKNISLHVCASPGCSIFVRSALTATYLLLSIFFIHLSHCY